MSIAGLNEKLVEAVCSLLCQKAATHKYFMSDVVVKMAHRGYEIEVHPDCSLTVVEINQEAGRG